MKLEHKKHDCQVIGHTVTLTRQTSYLLGIGNQVPIMQRDHGCSQEHICPHRYTEVCEVQQRNL